jgi:deoxyribodipyrimidine photo-lyase
MYSPTKQEQDQDPQGLFIRRWVPELAKVPLPYLAEPWKMDLSVQRMAACMIGLDYPLPIVDDKSAMKAAKDKMYALRKTPQAKIEADDVQHRHGSRRSGLMASGKRGKSPLPRPPSAPSPQGDLFS